MTAERILAHCASHPQAQPTDIFKFLHQSTFGCEHLLASPEAAVEYIKTEAATMENTEALVEPLDGEFCRVGLRYLKEGLRAETLGQLFFLSAKPSGSVAVLEEKLAVAEQLAAEGRLPFDQTAFAAALAPWKAAGYPALHHSEAFRATYRPAYRVIAKRFLPFLPLLAEIDRRGALTLAIEGGSASGKTTLSGLLEQLYDCTVLHMDDFFLQPHQRTPERFAEPGGNIDWERFLEEVLRPLSQRKPIAYRRFDCATFQLQPPVTITPKPLTVIEGAYSMHPALSEYYDLSVFLDVAPDLQKARIQKRNSPAMAARFFAEWIPMERRYWEAFQIPTACDMTIAINE